MPPALSKMKYRHVYTFGQMLTKYLWALQSLLKLIGNCGICVWSYMGQLFIIYEQNASRRNLTSLSCPFGLKAVPILIEVCSSKRKKKDIVKYFSYLMALFVCCAIAAMATTHCCILLCFFKCVAAFVVASTPQWQPHVDCVLLKQGNVRLTKKPSTALLLLMCQVC